MKNNLNTNSPNINELQSFVGDIKSILSSDTDLNFEKNALLQMIEQVDYLVGKHDDYCEEIDSTLSAMVEFDFTKRINSCEDNNNNLSKKTYIRIYDLIMYMIVFFSYI